MRINDGKSKLDEITRRRLTSVLVTPLQPPFTQPHKTFGFADGTKLAVTHAEAAAISNLLKGRVEGQCIMLSREGSQVMITLEDGK